MPTQTGKPDYYVYIQPQPNKCLTRIGKAEIVSGTHYRKYTGAGLNTSLDAISIALNDFWWTHEQLLFRPLEKDKSHRQFMADNYVPDFYYFANFRNREKQLKRIGLAYFVEGEAYRNEQGFDIDWEKTGIRARRERTPSYCDFILLPPTP